VFKNKAFNIKTFGKCCHCPDGLLVVEGFNLSRLRHLVVEEFRVVAYIGDVLCLFGRSVVIGRSDALCAGSQYDEDKVS
jgi:hypothetical protein